MTLTFPIFRFLLNFKKANLKSLKNIYLSGIKRRAGFKVQRRWIDWIELRISKPERDSSAPATFDESLLRGRNSNLLSFQFCDIWIFQYHKNCRKSQNDLYVLATQCRNNPLGLWLISFLSLPCLTINNWENHQAEIRNSMMKQKHKNLWEHKFEIYESRLHLSFEWSCFKSEISLCGLEMFRSLPPVCSFVKQ